VTETTCVFGVFRCLVVIAVIDANYNRIAGLDGLERIAEHQIYPDKSGLLSDSLSNTSFLKRLTGYFALKFHRSQSFQLAISTDHYSSFEIDKLSLFKYILGV